MTWFQYLLSFTNKQRPDLFISGCAVSTATNPILLYCNQYLFRHKGTILVIHQLGIPSHASSNFLNLVHHINFIPQDDSPFRPQYAIHLQKDVFQLAPTQAFTYIFHQNSKVVKISYKWGFLSEENPYNLDSVIKFR